MSHFFELMTFVSRGVATLQLMTMIIVSDVNAHEYSIQPINQDYNKLTFRLIKVNVLTGFQIHYAIISINIQQKSIKSIFLTWNQV